MGKRKKQTLPKQNLFVPLDSAPVKKHKALEEESPCFFFGDKENIGEADVLPRGLYNESNTCYLNSLIQVLFHLRPFKEMIFRLSPQSCDQKLKVLEALQWLFIDLEEGTDEKEIVTTNRLTKAFGWTSVNRGLQQDVHEFMQTLFNTLEKELPSDGFTELSSLLCGKLKRSIQCDPVGYESIKFEEVRGLSLPTISFMSVERSLESVFKMEHVEMNIEGHGKQTAEMRMELIDAPKILLLTLNRLKYDPVEQAVAKVSDFFEYKQRLQLSGHTYRLHSAVVHEGTASSGHYYCYISPTCNDKWYKFNDDKVCLSSMKDAVRDNYGKKSDPTRPTAYLLTYVREDCTDFFRSSVPHIPQSLRTRIADIRQLERVRLEYIQTAHLYTTVSLVPWAMMKGHSGYGLCDRMRLEQIHKERETVGVTTHGVTTYRVLKSSQVQELAQLHHPALTQDSVRLWAFIDREGCDGWSVHRPSKLIDDWSLDIASVSNLKCPFYIFVEQTGLDLHPTIFKTDMLSVFIKVFYNTSEGKDNPLRLEHHFVLSIDTTMESIRSAVMRLSNINTERYRANMYQEHSSMATERINRDADDKPLWDGLPAQVIRHAIILIVEIVNRSPTDTNTITDYESSAGRGTQNSKKFVVQDPVEDSLVSSVRSDTKGLDCETEEGNAVVCSALVDHMRELGTRVQVTWYNKCQSYLPSNTDGDFSLELRTDMEMCDVIEHLSKHLGCGVRNLIVYEAKRDQGYPQLQKSSMYDSTSEGSLMKLVYKQVHHCAMWRHSAVLFYEKLPMSIEEMAVRHKLTCSYIAADMVSHTLTLYPTKCKEGSEDPTTVQDLIELVKKETEALPSVSTRPLRVLLLKRNIISAILLADQLISPLLTEDLRLEHVTEEEEETETDFAELLASVMIDSAYLSRRGVRTEPFLLVVNRKETGANIVERINRLLKIQKEWVEKLEYRLVIPDGKGYALPDCKLSLKDWANLAHNDDTGSFEGCNYIKLTDALQPR